MDSETNFLVAKFWSMVHKSHGCWVWTGATNRGYGQFVYARRKVIKAHRFSWMIHHGFIESSQYVLHKCDNPPCVNPEHLFLGNHRDNMADKMVKGRQKSRDDHWFTTIKNSVLKEISEERLAEKSLASICRERGLNYKTVHHALAHRMSLTQKE